MPPKPPSGLLSCQYKRNVSIYSDDEKRDLVIPMDCGVCYNCRTTKRLTNLGKIAAEALICTRIDFYTFSYGLDKSPEGRAAAKLREPKHIKQMRDRLTQTDRRRIRKYNRAERKKAKAEGRKPNLIDESKQYIKTFVAHEWGSKATKRSHWHLIVLYLSHFPVPDDVVYTGDLHQTQRHCRRIWTPEHVSGPPPLKLPPNANNPDVLDFTTTGMQRWRFWPWGFINAQCVTHDTTVPDGQPMPLKQGQDLVTAVDYVTKYLGKQSVIPKGKSLYEIEKWTSKEKQAYYSNIRATVQRTMSRGMGHQFARVWARKHAEACLPLQNMTFKLAQHQVPRTIKSVAKHQAQITSRLKGREVDPIKGGMSGLALSMTEHRQTFKMTGSMADAAILEWRRVTEQLRGPVKVSALSDAMINALMRAESNEHKKFLESTDAEALRNIAASEGRSLPAFLPFVDVYAKNEYGDLLDGGKTGRDKRIKKIRTPAERYAQRRNTIEAQRRAYRHQPDDLEALKRYKRVLGNKQLCEISTEMIYAARPQMEKDRFRREYDVERVQHVLADLRKKIDKDPLNIDAIEELEWIEEWLIVKEREALGLKRETVASNIVTEQVLLHWLNYSDDYNFPYLREQAIREYCWFYVDEPNFQVVQNYTGQCFVRHKLEARAQTRIAEVENAKPMRVRKYQRWFTTAIDLKPEDTRWAYKKEDLFHYDVIDDGDAPIFVGETPLRKHPHKKKVDRLVALRHKREEKQCQEYLDLCKETARRMRRNRVRCIKETGVPF